MIDERHDISAFGKLPWDDMELRTGQIRQGGNWSYGQAADGSWQITIVYADGSSHTWQLPEPLWVILEMQYRFGREHTQQDVRRAIGL